MQQAILNKQENWMKRVGGESESEKEKSLLTRYSSESEGLELLGTRLTAE